MQASRPTTVGREVESLMATTGRRKRAPAEAEEERAEEEDEAEEQVEFRRFGPLTELNATNAVSSDIVQETVL